MTRSFELIEPNPKVRMSTNRRILYFLVALMVILPVITGVLVWHFMPKCDKDQSSTAQEQGVTSGTQSSSGSTTETTSPPGTTPDSFEDGPWKILRLPRTVLPVHYDIILYPDFYGDSAWFYGNETIEIDISGETKHILIHINFLNITNTSLEDENGSSIVINRTFEYKPNQFLVIETKEMIPRNRTVWLKIQFDGSLTRSIVGLYKSVYVNSLTKQRRAITTSKFEPVSARRAFPCFDEPNIKAEFTIALVHQPDYIALSNMNVQKITPWIENAALQQTQFYRSVKMSTYLVCFIVCDFDYLETTTANNNTVRVYAPPDRVNYTEFALEVANVSVDLYTDLFAIPYPLPKLDLIAIPDFVSGAMEHWGLITFRETNILFDPEEASSANQQRVSTVVAHEVSHQWFGNLVTMDWWDDLWLNEGFASFMEYLGSDEASPSWDLLDQFVVDDLQPIMVTDSGVSSHPIVVDVKNPDQINEVFDGISYSKGASVIRMLQSLMGKEAFFRGVSKYLKKYTFRNAKTDDLWTELGQVTSDLSVKEVMDTWTKQMGLPYINVSVDSSGSQVTVEQRRFLANPATQFDPSESPFGYKWMIGLDYATSEGEMGKYWMKKTDTETLNFQSSLGATSWIKFNMNETGFYRVNYPTRIWKTFSTELNGDISILHTADRANLIDDAFNLARAGILEYDVALEMTSYLHNEMEHLPWESASSGFSYLTSMLRFSGSYGLLNKYLLKKVSPVLQKLTWQDRGSHLEKLMRSNIILLACGNGHQECLNNATDRFLQWLRMGVKIPPNLRSLVYKYGMMRSDSVEDWDLMWKRYLEETVPQEKIKLIFGLAQTRTVWLLLRYIEYAKNETLVRSQDYFYVLTYIARNPVGRAIVWDWIRDNWQYLVDRFTLFSRSFGRLVPNVVSSFNTKRQLKEVEDFFKLYPEAGAGGRGRQRALEDIRTNIAWMKTNYDTITSWLETEI